MKKIVTVDYEKFGQGNLKDWTIVSDTKMVDPDGNEWTKSESSGPSGHSEE